MNVQISIMTKHILNKVVRYGLLYHKVIDKFSVYRGCVFEAIFIAVEKGKKITKAGI